MKGVIVGDLIGPLAGILIFVIVLAGITFQVTKLTAPTRVQAEFIAKDLALFIEMAASAPGSVDVLYNPQRDKNFEFSYDFGKDVKIWWKDDTQNVFSHPLLSPVESSKFRFDKSYIIPRVVKTDSKVSIYDANDGDNVNIFSRNCPKFSGDVVFDPGHGGSDKGLSGKSFESVLSRETVSALISLGGSKGVAFGSTRDITGEVDVNTLDRKNAIGSNAVVSIHVGNANVVKAFINRNPASFALACNLLKGFSSSDYEGVVIVPVDVSRLSLSNPKSVLGVPGAGVLLEIGNMNSFNSIKIANALWSGLK